MLAVLRLDDEAYGTSIREELKFEPSVMAISGPLTLLHWSQPLDATTFAAAAQTLLRLATMAAWHPASRA